MNTHADKTQENKSQSVANAVSQKQSSGESSFQFVDNRPEAIAQRELQEMANNGSQATQMRSFQNIEKNAMIQTEPVWGPNNHSSMGNVRQLVRVIQRGGSDWTEHGGRELIEKRWERGGYACFYTEDSTSFYSEAWLGEKKNIKYAGAVQIEPKGETLLLHTRSEHGMEGGLGIVMMSEAVKLIAQYHSGYSFVQMTPAPGAASKKVIEILSAQIGDPEIHASAVEAQKTRKAWQKDNPVDRSGETPEEREARLQTWSPEILPEHNLHLESLAASSETEGIQITGPAGGFLGFDAEASQDASAHTEVISGDGHASGYGIYIPMGKFLKVAKGF